MKNPPCGKNCPDRYVKKGINCHSTCKKYLEWDKERKEELKRIYQIKEVERNITEVRKGKIDRDYIKF